LIVLLCLWILFYVGRGQEKGFVAKECRALGDSLCESAESKFGGNVGEKGEGA
jgi:hypothetical protein